MSFNWKEFDLYNPTPEHSMLRETVNAFTKAEVEPQAHEYDRSEKFNLGLFKKVGELGLLGITVPEQFGGAGMDATAAAIVHEELSASDPGFALAYLAHSMLCVNNIAVNGNDEQRMRVLPKLCSGEWVGSMSMSEPAVGTDVMGMQTRAEKKGDGWILNGRKMWITNGTIDENNTPCDLTLVYAITGEKNGRALVSTFLVEKDHKGFQVGQKIKDKLGMRGSNTAELVFQDCEIPASALIGHEGDSMLHMMRNLEIERLTLAAMSLGIARRSVEIMNRYATEREAFGKSLNHFGQMQRYIADSYAEYKSARAYVYETARRMDLNKEGNRLDSDGVKLVATTMAKNVADRAIQVLGGYGYVGEYVVERLWRDAKLLEIGGGTLEAHQKNITRDLARNPESLYK
ncbi:acyl-CoA dehydrogenase family protein [Bdellovibrio sp. SKB1291214]|uniref:acyl-CoA dehydrogenase family protein n=1 Tax=Bdellovibrio sp. SKB1291214 TaxID=1732569 RepID=UPI00223FCAE8|nr:acyl-CoA dehydrogenase family protein [Bdellovibrio sp. SKB1291214]UYL09635.1 acyl-CoA dehydrogenase family protein [Bdellovibrio sp. SKB1291214]